MNLPKRPYDDYQFNQEELKLLADEFRRINFKPPPEDFPTLKIWEEKEKLPIYKTLHQWIMDAKKNNAIGTCKAESKIDNGLSPVVRKGARGIIINPIALRSLPSSIRANLYKVPSQYLNIIFGKYFYFVDPNRLTEIKYVPQMNLF